MSNPILNIWPDVPYWNVGCPLHLILKHLIISVASLAQLVSPSVALPAELVLKHLRILCGVPLHLIIKHLIASLAQLVSLSVVLLAELVCMN